LKPGRWCSLSSQALTFEELRRRLGVADDLGGVDVGDGEAPAHDIAAAFRQRLVEHGERRSQRLERLADDGGIALLRRIGGEMVGQVEGVGLALGRGPERPHCGEAFLLHVLRRDRPAMLAREVEIDRQRFVHDEAVIVDRGHMAIRIDRHELGAAGMDRRARSVGVRHAIDLDHRHMLEGDAEFVGEPDIARRARAIAAIDGQGHEQDSGEREGAPNPGTRRRKFYEVQPSWRKVSRAMIRRWISDVPS
jgi:hypothetical protein